MKKDLWLSIIRTLLTGAGAYLIGKNLFGNTIDQSIWGEVSGVAMVMISSIWGFITKELKIEALEDALKQAFVVLGTLAVMGGKLSTGLYQTILTLLPMLFGILGSSLARMKNNGLANGSISTSSLKK